jgi:hypothetical protein
MVTAARRVVGGVASLAQLQAQSACGDVVRASFRLIDEGRATQAAELYTVDATLTLSHPAAKVGDVTLRGADIHRAMRQREAEDRITVHVLSNPTFQLADPDLAESECHLQVYRLGEDRTESPEPRTLGHVRDILARRADGVWRISERRITILAGNR